MDDDIKEIDDAFNRFKAMLLIKDYDGAADILRTFVVIMLPDKHLNPYLKEANFKAFVMAVCRENMTKEVFLDTCRTLATTLSALPPKDWLNDQLDNL
jgi:hypothetical protein